MFDRILDWIADRYADFTYRFPIAANIAGHAVVSVLMTFGAGLIVFLGGNILPAGISFTAASAVGAVLPTGFYLGREVRDAEHEGIYSGWQFWRDPDGRRDFLSGLAGWLIPALALVL